MSARNIVLYDSNQSQEQPHAAAQGCEAVMIHVAASRHRQGSFFCNGIYDCRLIIQNETLKASVTLMPTPEPLIKRKSEDRTPLKMVLKNCDKGAEM